MVWARILRIHLLHLARAARPYALLHAAQLSSDQVLIHQQTFVARTYAAATAVHNTMQVQVQWALNLL